MSEEVTLDDFSEDDDKGDYEDQWGEIRLIDLCDMGGGSTPKKSNSDYWDGGEILWTSPKDFNGPRLTDTEDKITKQGAKESTSKIYPPGTTLLVVRSGVLRHTLPVSITEKPTTVNQDLKALEPDEEQVNGEYFFQALSGLSEDIRGGCKKTGTTVESIQTNVLKQYPVPVPPKPEQRKIATVLYTVDQAIEKTEEIREQTEQVKRGVAQNLFHYGIEKEDTKETWLGEIPESWDVIRFSEIVDSNRNGLYKSKDAYGKGHPIAKMGNALEQRVLDMSTADRLKLTKKEKEKYGLKQGDLIFARRAQEVSAAGDCCYVPSLDELTVFESSLIRVRLSEDVSPRFYVQYFEGPVGSRSIDRIVTETSISGVATSDLLDLKVALPSLKEQNEIASILWGFDEQIKALEKEIDQYKRLKEGFMQDLLSGTVRTTDTTIAVPDEIAQHG